MQNSPNSTQVAPESTISPFSPELPSTTKGKINWGRLYGNSAGLVITRTALQHEGPLLIIANNSQRAMQLENEISFYAADTSVTIASFPDWETLPYDLFSPHQDIISQRLKTLHMLGNNKKCILIVPVSTLMQHLLPREYLETNSLILDTGDQLDPDKMRQRLEKSGYYCVSQVMEHGEYAMRGSLLDLFPMGSELPYRIDLFDNEIETIRTFSPDTQRTIEKIKKIQILPAREFPVTDESISNFRQAYRKRFEGDPQRSQIYKDVSQGLMPPGIEYYLPLFFETTDTLLNYLPDNTLVCTLPGVTDAAESFWEQITHRYEQRKYDIERPILKPEELYQDPAKVLKSLDNLPVTSIHQFEIENPSLKEQKSVNYSTFAPPILLAQPRSEKPYTALETFLLEYRGRILLVAESTGRREFMLDILRDIGLHPTVVKSWYQFVESDSALCITVSMLDEGLNLQDPNIIIITEAQIFGERTKQSRRIKKTSSDPEKIIRNLTDLHIGAPVVHEEHGVGRYLGLEKLGLTSNKPGNEEPEFLTIEYADGDKLYVPVSSLHLISRYTGSAAESAPLHKLGSDRWQRIKRKAAEKARDVAAELLDIYSRRAARRGHAYKYNDAEYSAFVSTFPFDETEDQDDAINTVLHDMSTEQPMDRVVCGDVGFGKTEVAMRAAFIATQDNKQVAVLVPTTLLAQQHYQNFIDRFSEWPIKIEVLSRFRSSKQQTQILGDLENGKIDIIIGTHKLLQKDVKFRDLGLVINDEEHRFGVRQKEKLKSLRSEVDILTLTATPIPRTLNMSLSGLRDLSIISTAPIGRIAIKTFVSEWDDTLLLEAFQRELKRGGQIYFLHNEVKTIDRILERLQALLPEADIRIAHGQMRERELEQVMLDFYHQRFNVLLCTTIIESGIDVPSANTIIINRADKLGLAQLHQLRGRVGRSHHRAYAYLLIPERKALTSDALKRLEAIESLEDLGAGFMLATHDLEIRGAGELLGEGQSGQIHEIGFTMYSELLERAVKALKSGKQPELDKPLDHGPEIDLHLPAVLPEDYIPDVHMRLIMYKRIASAMDAEQLRDLQVEMIDRFGLLPTPAKTLIHITELKLKALPLGIKKIDAGETGGYVIIGDNPNINTTQILNMIQTQPIIYKLDGQNKLRFKMDLESKDKRIQSIAALLDTITIDPDTKIQCAS